jgi:cytochrome c oxidase subunit 2
MIRTLSFFIAFAATGQSTTTLFTNHCARCHGPAAEGVLENGTPTLPVLGAWYIESQLHAFKYGRRGTGPNDDHGREMRGIARIYITGEQAITAIAAHVAALPVARPETTVQGDRERGKTLYAACAGCHGDAAEGRQEFVSPALRGQHDWYLLRQLQHYRDGERGTPGEPMQLAMASLPDEQAFRDVVAYIAKLGRE